MLNVDICPVCGYDRLEFPPKNYTICACCGTEFGYDNRVLTFDEIRDGWTRAGCPWFDPDEQQPVNWNPWKQMIDAQLVFEAVWLHANIEKEEISAVERDATDKDAEMVQRAREGQPKPSWMRELCLA